MRFAVARLGDAAAIAECVKLFDITNRRAGLLDDPFAQADFESAMANGIEGARRQSRFTAAIRRMGGEDQRPLARHGHDGRGETDFDGEFGGSRHRGPISR